MSWTAESRKVLGSLIVLGMVLSTFTAAVSVVATSLPPKLIPNISLAPVENLVGYWSFNEGEGDIAHDGSGLGNHGTIHGAQWVDGIYGQALSFDGVDDNVLIPHNSSLNVPGTISAWVWWNGGSLTSGRHIVNKRLPTPNETYHLAISPDGKVSAWVVIGGTGYELISTTTIPAYEWLHIVMTHNGTNLRIYINGVEDSNSPRSAPGVVDTNTAPLNIGTHGDPNDPGHVFPGKIDEVRIYNRALSASEINSIYQEGVGAASTTLSISPSSFTLASGGSTTLTATLTSGGSPVAGKTITWTKTAGSLSATNGTTNSSGQVTVTYTAPTVTVQTSVTVTASFAGDATYSGSQASSVGTVTTTAQASTSIVVSPLVFDAKSGETMVMTILLTGKGAPLAGKTVTLSTTAGSITPSSGTTDSAGTITTTFTAPSVDVRTSFIITASFAGDDEYSPTVSYSTGTVLPPKLAETVERLENTMTKLELAIENLAPKIESLTSALAENRLALVIIVEEGQSETEYEHTEIDAEVKITGTNIEVRVDSPVESGKTVLVNIDNYTKKVLQLEHIVVWVDNQEIGQADDYDDVLDPTDDGDEAEYLILVGGNGIQVLVSIPHFSVRTITIGTLPTMPTAGEIPMWVIAAAALALVIAMTAVIWRYLRESRGETTSVLIEHGLPRMRIDEVEVVREIRGMKEFTIPDIMQRTGSSKVLVWRTVQKLMEKGLVEPTEEVKPPAAGRGKPSMVFKYVGD